MFSLREYREPTNRLPDYLPWAAIIAPGVVLQKDCALQKTIGFRGHDLASASPEQLLASVAKFNNALKRLGSGWSIHVEAQRFKSDGFPESDWKSFAAEMLENERREQFSKKGHYESRYFLTFTWKMPNDKAQLMERLFYKDESGTKSDSVEQDLEHFQRTVNEITDIMSGVFEEVHALDDDETLTYLHSTVSTNWHKVKAPQTPMYLDALLPDQPLSVGETCLLGDYYIPTCTFTGFPTTTFPGILDDLNHLNIEYRWTVRFICLGKLDAEKEVKRYRQRWWQGRKGLLTLLKEGFAGAETALVNTDAENKASDADTALQEIGDDVQAFGYTTCAVTVWHKDAELATRQMQSVMRVIQSRGFTVKEERFNNVQAWLGSLPGNVYANVRRPLIGTLNLAHMMPLSAIWAGDQENTHLKEQFDSGLPHIMCSTTGDTLFRLHLAVGDVGHTLIVGATGSGKSTLTNMLALQWLRYPEAQVVIFDKDKSARCATLAVGGQYYEPGGENAPLAFQPLAHVDEAAERAWAAEFIANLLDHQNFLITPEIRKEIDGALQSLSGSEKQYRTLTGFCNHCVSNGIKDALLPYLEGGVYGGLFDASEDGLRDGFWQMIEMGALMNLSDHARIPAMQYLFHRIERRFDGRPTILIIDEAWLFLSHPLFMQRIQSWLKTLRKKNVYVVFATQEIADAADSPIMPTILSACHTKIYLPDEEALTPAMKQAYLNFGLSETEVHLLSRAQKKRDYYYRSVKGCRMFSLDMGSVALAFCAMTKPDDQKFMDWLERTVEPEAYPLEMLKYKGIELIENMPFGSRKKEEV